LVGWNQSGAILWAQWRTLRNYIPRSNVAGMIFSGVLAAVWYGMFLFLAGLAVIVFSDEEQIDLVRSILPNALLLCFLYWQLIPVLMASMGSSLDIKKLLVYPIPTGELFTLEVLLRISSGIEMMILMGGAGIGLLLNPAVPKWAPFSLLLFVAFNLLCSAGVRDLLVRLLARRRIREVAVLLFVIAAALPQLLLMTGGAGKIKRYFSGEPSAFLPWTAAARIASGEPSWRSVGVLLAWTVAAYIFGRWQFERGLTFDASAAGARVTSGGRKTSRLEWFYNLPNLFLPDPLGCLIEKELRFLTRAPRFRLVFLMGFTFGLLIWAPMAFGQTGSRATFMTSNYLTLVAVYALLLLSDALFWNCFGFDRSATQIYFLVPVKLSTVIIGKNITAGFFVSLEVAGIALVCKLLRLPLSGWQVLEAAAVTVVVTLFLLTIGNLSSVYNPRSVNPVKSFRTAAGGRTQAVLMLAFPLAMMPVALAYLARYAFDTEWAFFGVLLFGAILGGIVYSFAMDTAVKAAWERREEMIAALSRGAGPIES
jgi:ABC-2 type transport system permease protein